MKVLYLNPDRGIPVLGDKGASVHVREFVTGATALGHDVVLACARLGSGNAPPPARILPLEVRDDNAFLEDACRLLGLESHYLGNPTARREIVLLAYDLGLPERLLLDLATMGFAPDVLYERHTLFSSSGATIAAHLGVPRILEVNAPLVAEQATHRGLFLTDLALTKEAESYRNADVIIAVSEAVAAHVRSVTRSTGEVRVIANGVDVARFGSTGSRQMIRTQLGLGDEEVVGFVGSFKTWHGVGQLLEAFERVLRKHPNARLIALGDGPELPALRTRAASSAYASQILFPGRVPHCEIPHWLAAMDLTVAPYLPQEDFYFSPLKIVESLAAARPVVAPRIGQIADLIADGTTGLLYTPGSVEGCAEAICTLLNEPDRCAAMGQAGRRLAIGRDWKNVVAQVLASIDSPIVEQSA